MIVREHPRSQVEYGFRDAMLLWASFFLCLVVINGTLPFVFGSDLHAWTTSEAKKLIFSSVIYGIFFLAAPLILVKGWDCVRRPAFIFPLLAAIIALTLNSLFRGMAAFVILILAYLHRRYDLSDLGFRSYGWKADAGVVVLLALFSSLPALLKIGKSELFLGRGILAGLDRLLANPASTVEYLFYFGFLLERAARKYDRWIAPLLIACLYILHEVSNPEYWYSQMPFLLTFFGVWFAALVYLWRRNIVAIWLGDGFGRFLSRLF